MRAKRQKLEKAIANRVQRHRDEDALPQSDAQHERDLRQIEKLQKQIEKYDAFLASHSEEKRGASGKPVKSNITDNDSAKMKTSKGVLQGYTGIAVADSWRQVILGARAEGVAQEQATLPGMVEEIKTNLRMLADDEEKKAYPLKGIKFTGDSGFHSEDNLQLLADEKADAYLADNRFRKRDPEQTSPRSVNFMTPENTLADGKQNLTKLMKQKIDSEEGRRIYSERLGTIEPPFGHIQGMDLDYFSLRGQEKVNIQWHLFTTVHNLKKVHNYAHWQAL